MADVRFDGWPASAVTFFEGLERDNSKRYWEAHRDLYQHDVKAPMLALLGSLTDEFGQVKLFRPYRDVRFSPDKTPYKTSIAAMIGTGYVGLSAEGLEVGAGFHQMTSPQLDRYRTAVADDRRGTALERIVGSLRGQGLDVRSFDELKSAPRGYPKDHPRIELLRYKGVVAMRSWPPGPWLGTTEVRDRVATFLRSAAPLVDWLTANVGPDAA